MDTSEPLPNICTHCGSPVETSPEDKPTPPACSKCGCVLENEAVVSPAETNRSCSGNEYSPETRPPRFSLRLMLIGIAGVAFLLGTASNLGVLAAIGLVSWMLTCVIWWAMRLSVAGVFFTTSGTATLLIGSLFVCQSEDGFALAVNELSWKSFGSFLTVIGSVAFLVAAVRQHPMRKGNALGAVAGGLVLVLSISVLYPVCVSIGRAKVALGLGPVTERSEFPMELQEFLEVAGREGIIVEELDVYCQVDGIWDEEYYWKMKASPELIDLAGSLWHLAPSDKSILQVQGSWQRVPPSHVAPVTNETQLYITSGSCVPFVVHDKTDEMLYCHYIFSF